MLECLRYQLKKYNGNIVYSSKNPHWLLRDDNVVRVLAKRAQGTKREAPMAQYVELLLRQSPFKRRASDAEYEQSEALCAKVSTWDLLHHYNYWCAPNLKSQLAHHESQVLQHWPKQMDEWLQEKKPWLDMLEFLARWEATYRRAVSDSLAVLSNQDLVVQIERRCLC